MSHIYLGWLLYAAHNAGGTVLCFVESNIHVTYQTRMLGESEFKMSLVHLRRGNAPALGRLWDLIRGKQSVDRYLHDTRGIPREDGGDIIKELERILKNQRVLDSLTSPGELHVAVACLSAST